MGRPRKISSETIVENAKEYFSIICNGNIKKMTYKNLAEYINNKNNMKVADYDLKKCTELKEYIAEIKNEKERILLNSVIYFKRLDINNFLRINNTEAKLRNALIHLDTGYEEVCKSAAEIYEENKRIRERNTKLLSENNKLKSENIKLGSNQGANAETENLLKAEIKKLKERIRVLLNIINTNVYPEIANELLAETGFIKVDNKIVSDVGMRNIMNDNDSIISFIEKREEILSKGIKNQSNINTLITDLENNIMEDE